MTKLWKDVLPGDVVVINLPLEGETLHLVLERETAKGFEHLVRMFALQDGVAWVATTRSSGEALCL